MRMPASAFQRKTGRAVLISACIGAFVAGAGCRGLEGSQPLPAGTPDPATLRTAAGAQGMYVVALSRFQTAFAGFIVNSGLLTDELQTNARGAAVLNGLVPDGTLATDTRTLNQGSASTDKSYADLQNVRTYGAQAIGALGKYAESTSGARRGELYALQGMAEIMLADLFCSGVPLSTYDFEGDYTYHASSTTEQVYQDAITLLARGDSLGADSAPILNLSRVGLGRAYLALGQYAAAAAAVHDVPTDFQYVEQVSTCNAGFGGCNATGSQTGEALQAAFTLPFDASVSDHEGINGLPYISGGDPRTTSAFVGTTTTGFPIYVPAKYTTGGVSPLLVASGVEARLIEAEANLKAGGTQWLTILNALRTDGTFTISTRTAIPGVSPGPLNYPDTTWGPGTGAALIPASVIADASPVCEGPDPITQVTPPCSDTQWYRGLGPLHDPGTDSGRVTMLFHERATWLFATGHRQGDLRRLIRQYPNRRKSGEYPVGSYPGLGGYGANIDAPIPVTESYNKLFHGCLSRD